MTITTIGKIYIFQTVDIDFDGRKYTDAVEVYAQGYTQAVEAIRKQYSDYKFMGERV